ncbi:hypothetical protein V6N13_118829 [Hibiscus sabdariffa]|uniref:GATA-type domain-containing protein n=1 Tax=Hibiscus sabdariffa TaxID=183260 RepID=A0ABR2DZF7_9ROSI
MSSSNCYSSLYPFPIDLNEDVYNDQQHFHDLQEEKVDVLQDGPLKSDCELKLSIWKQEEEERVETHRSHENISSAKWMPSKMRILRKMMNSDHVDLSNNYKLKSEDQHKQQHPISSAQDDSRYSSCNNNNSSTIRVCADCNTTKTPLWRSGPRGPKSLCNACGIRQRKARRAMAAAAAAAATGTAVAAETTTTANMKNKVQLKAKRSSDDCVPHFKNKRCKLNPQSQSRKKPCFEDLRIILSKNSAFHRVFPQDEKEAAILLMALSYGLVHG